MYIMTKFAQMVLKGDNCLHNDKIRSYGLQRSQFVYTVIKIRSNSFEK